jgi:uncharacterized membrane protein YccC
MRVPELLVARRGRVRLRGVRTLKTTVAAVTAWLVALPLSDNPRPVLAPLTALLVVQLTLYDTLRSGLRRVVSVVVGVLVAVALSDWVALTWWSLAIAVAGSLVLGRLLRLGPEVAEVPISAMLVLAVGGTDIAASGRVVETLIGAAVGIAVSALVAPPLYVRPASDAVQSLARATADVLRTVAREVDGEYTREQAEAWLSAARGLGRDILTADRALGRAEQSLRLNPRARDKRHTGPSLRSGLETLERVSVSLRGVCRSLADRAGGDVPEQVYAEDVRHALRDLLQDVATAVESYGALVGSEVVGAPEDAALRASLHDAWEDRDRVFARLREGERLQGGAGELLGDLAANIDRLLRDLDSEARAELRMTWPTRAAVPRPVLAARSRLRREPSGGGGDQPAR